MTYNFNRKKSFISSIPLGWWIFSLLLIAVLIIFRGTWMRVIAPVHAVPDNLIDKIVNITTPKKILIQRQQQLQEENQKLKAQLLGVQLVEDENKSLRTILDYPKLATTEIIAYVVSKPTQSVYNRIVIDRGARDEVVVGDKIIAGENGFIATIDQVSETTSSGTLVSSNFFKGDAVITRLGITVPVTGKGSGNFELHIPRDLDVRDGDVMTLPGAPNFIFGIIKTIQFDERDPYQTVLARTPVNVQELKFVRVIK